MINNQLERDIEKAVCAYAKAIGVLSFKYTGVAGIPDRVYLYKGRTLFAEFKRKGGKPRPLQQHYIDKINAQGIKAIVIDDVRLGKQSIDDFKKLGDLNE